MISNRDIVREFEGDVKQVMQVIAILCRPEGDDMAAIDHDLIRAFAPVMQGLTMLLEEAGLATRFTGEDRDRFAARLRQIGGGDVPDEG